jgi:hypothetical protein
MKARRAPTAKQLYSHAIHEAGHVVCILNFGHPFKFVEIGDAPHELLDGSMGSRWGRVHYGDPEELPMVSAREEIVELWGGMAAQKIHRPRNNWVYYMLTGGMEDVRIIKVVRDKHNNNPRTKWLITDEYADRQLKDMAVTILKRDWDKVIKIADALIVRGKLTYAEVQEVLQ